MDGSLCFDETSSAVRGLNRPRSGGRLWGGGWTKDGHKMDWNWTPYRRQTPTCRQSSNCHIHQVVLSGAGVRATYVVAADSGPTSLLIRSIG